MTASWQQPVRGRFTFTPAERQRAGAPGGVARRPMVQGEVVGEEILEKDSCYCCGKRGGYHHRGCPRYF